MLFVASVDTVFDLVRPRLPQSGTKMVVFSHWEPDEKIHGFNSTRITFPDFDPALFDARQPPPSGGAATTRCTPPFGLYKVYKPALHPSAREVIDALSINSAYMNAMLQRLLEVSNETAGADDDYDAANFDPAVWSVACDWSRAHPEIVSRWLPRCPEGTFREEVGESTCAPCPAGRYREAGTREDRCTACPPGTYGPFEGASSCISCVAKGAAFYQERAGQVECDRCPLLTRRPGGTPGLNVTECHCAAGAYSETPDDSGRPCLACPEGAQVRSPPRALAPAQPPPKKEAGWALSRAIPRRRWLFRRCSGPMR